MVVLLIVIIAYAGFREVKVLCALCSDARVSEMFRRSFAL
jgi:hypothetical protein